ncbi:MAG: FecR domain-containing protein [Clostridiales bacterium]|nr:FecR domain-containing protein [Clostridiales bacterium]
MSKIKEKWDKLTKKKKIIYGSSAGVILAGIIIAIILSTTGYYATTMRLLRVEGTVNIEDGNGNSKPIMENARFQSGDAINTGSASLASIGLDDDKIITLDENSRAEFSKKRKQIELKLTQGGLYFDVQKPLEPDETMDIKTSTMIVGIRGTSGYVFVDEDGRECILVTDGCVHVTGINPVTGEEKETDVRGGQLVKVYLYYDRTEDSVEFYQEIIDEYDIPDFVLDRLREDPDLLAKVCDYTGWDPYIIMGIIDTMETETSETSEPSESSESSESTEPGETSEPSDPSGTPSPSVTVTPRPSGTVTPTPAGGNGGSSGGSGDSDPTPTPRGTTTPVPTGSSATPTPRGTTTPVPTSTPRPTSTVAPTSTPKPTSTPIPTTTPEPTPTEPPTAGEIIAAIPLVNYDVIVGLPEDREEEDYELFYYGEDEHLCCVIVGNQPPPEDHAPGETGPRVTMGYVNGQWRELSISEKEIYDNGLETIYTYYYTSGGKSVTYYEESQFMG